MISHNTHECNCDKNHSSALFTSANIIIYPHFEKNYLKDICLTNFALVKWEMEVLSGIDYKVLIDKGMIRII